MVPFVMHSSEGLLRMRPDKPAYTAASLAASYKLDEGYSDDTKSQLEGEDGVAQNVSMLLPDWILAYSDSERAGACLAVASRPYCRCTIIN